MKNLEVSKKDLKKENRKTPIISRIYFILKKAKITENYHLKFSAEPGNKPEFLKLKCAASTMTTEKMQALPAYLTFQPGVQ